MELRQQLPKRTSTLLSIAGLGLFFIVWQLIRSLDLVQHSILPGPIEVLASYKELHFNDFLIRNIGYSLQLNFMGYIEAIAFALPLGFLIGLNPIVREMSSKMVDAIRYIPLTAVTGLFISWFGLEMSMKIHFLSFAIFVYLLPTVALRVAQVDDIYVQTAFTLGATKWQMIRKVFIPAVLPKVSDDIRLLVAISWTYIIVAELINAEGGVGRLINYANRDNRLDKVFAVLIVIMVIGILQDKLFKWIDKRLFPFKYQ